MNKYLIATAMLSVLILASCASSNQIWQGSFRWWRRWWPWMDNWSISDIVRLKDRQRPEFWSWAKMWSWNINKSWTWAFLDRFKDLSEEDKTKLQTAMEARRSWDTKSYNSVMTELKAKYPSTFSWSQMWFPWNRRQPQ